MPKNARAHSKPKRSRRASYKEYRNVGDSGLIVSAVGLGCNNLGREGTPTQSQEGTNQVIRAAVEAGITLFDLADVYGKRAGLSEERFAARGPSRESIRRSPS